MVQQYARRNIDSSIVPSVQFPQSLSLDQSEVFDGGTEDRIDEFVIFLLSSAQTSEAWMDTYRSDGQDAVEQQP